jgi:adenosine deaminase
MLDRSLRATVNSDDPAYFGAYVNQNLAAAKQAVDLTLAELAQLARNSFQIAWLTPADRARYLADLDAYVTQNSLPSGPGPSPFAELISASAVHMGGTVLHSRGCRPGKERALRRPQPP